MKLRSLSFRTISLSFSLILGLFSCSSLKDGLLVYYPFSGNANDKSGNDHHGTVFGSTLGEDRNDKKNSSFYFDGTNDYIDLGNILDDLHYPFTVSVWVKPANHAGLYNTIFTAQDNSPLYNGFEIHIRKGTSFGVILGDGRGENNGAYMKSKSADITDRTGEWTYIAAVISGNDDIKLYLNGVETPGEYSGYTTFPMNSNFPNDVARIGRWTSNGNTYYYKGFVDEFRVWNRALSEDEIKKSM